MEIKKSIPMFDKEQIIYRRSEKDGSELMISKKHPELQQLTFNATSMRILELCNGKRDIEALVNELLKTYKKVDPDVLLNDVIGSLHTLWRLGLVEWINRNPYAAIYNLVEKNSAFTLLTEDKVLEWIKTIEPQYYNPFNDEKILYSDTTIRQSTFSFFESFFQIIVDGIPVFTISFIIPIGEMTFLTVGLMHYTKEIEVELLNNFFTWSIKKLKDIYLLASNVNGIVIYNRDLDNILSEFIKNLGFIQCGTLFNEFDNNSEDYVTVYYIPV